MTHDPSSPSKFLAPDKSGTRMHDRLAKFLERDSGTSNLDEELGSCAMGLIKVPIKITKKTHKRSFVENEVSRHTILMILSKLALYTSILLTY